LNVPAWRKWANHYSAGNIPEAAGDFLASATGWALHKQTWDDRDATRLRGEARKVRPLAVGSVLSRLAHCHAIARIVTFVADHLRHVQRSVFTKAGVERAIHTSRIGLQAILDCNLLSLDMENAFNTISRRSFLAEMYKNPDLHPVIPLVEMIYSRDSTVNYVDPNDASLLHGTVQSRTGVQQGDPLGPLLFNLAISTPLRSIGERCKDSAAIQAFFDDGKYLIKTRFVPTVITVATEKLGKVCSNVQPIKSSCMVPQDMALELVEVIRAMVPVVTGASILEASLAIDFSMAYGPPTYHNENYVHSWLQDTVEAHQLLLGKIVCFAMSDFGGTHAAFRLMITCAARRYGFLLRTLPPNICRPYLATPDRAVRTKGYRILSVSHDVQTLDQLNCAKRQLSVPAEFGGLMYRPSSSTHNMLTMLHSLRPSPTSLVITSPSR
jgi:hypothetical protein